MDDDDDTIGVDNITLTGDQQVALDKFVTFLTDPKEQVFVLEGYSGTGKSTLIKTLVDRLPGYLKTIKLINPSAQEFKLQLTATTNKAADAFSHITGMDVRTIHSFLSLRVSTDYRTKQTELIPATDVPEEGYLLFIDEASKVGSKLLELIFKQTKNCKIVFLGDRAQLIEVKAFNAPVFMAGFPGAMLTKVMRQTVNGIPQDNPITDLATQFRETVSTGIWTPFKPDGNYVIHLPREDFDAEVLAEFTRPGWKFSDSKFLAWTNKRVTEYNTAISSHVTGDPELQEGDYASVNKYVSHNKSNLKTDQMVYVSCVEPNTTEYGVLGNYVTLDHAHRFFLPKNMVMKKAREKQARDEEDFNLVQHINERWIDLRSVFAQTTDKSQGSTYDTVFIDIDDIARCPNGNTIARMMYVGVSRARKRVFMTGDFG